VAEAILRKNAARLGSLLKKATEKYGPRDSFVEAGGFFKNEAYRSLVESESGCTLLDPGLPPVYGACVEALRRADRSIPAGFRKKFIKTYGGYDAENRDAQ